MAFKKFNISLALAASLMLLSSCSTFQPTKEFNFRYDSLLIDDSNFTMRTSINSLLKNSNALVKKKFKNILDKSIIPASGNKNDYTSRAVYYWPEKKLNKTIKGTTNKWKYIDGKINKESLVKTDHSNYYDMLTAIKKLSLAYYFSNNEKYSNKCITLIKEWFINEKTRMNPNFNYAQAIPGRNTGTPSGIIDARGILWVIDAVENIKDSNLWSEELDSKFKDWCSELLDWLLTSDFGKREGLMKNNHGTFYELQVVSLSSYLGNYGIAEEFIVIAKKRIEEQIAPDGSQPQELKRVSSHMYSVFNLSALIEIAEIAINYNIDLWNYKNMSCGSIKDAVDFLVINYKIDNRKIFNNKVSYKNLMRILPKANELSKGRYEKVINKILSENDHINLTEMYFVN